MPAPACAMPMRQQTLHGYFPTTYKPAKPSSKLSLLDLPYDIRHRIYVLAGLVRFCPIDLNLEYTNPALAQQEHEYWQNSWEYRHRTQDFNYFALFRCVYRQRRFLDDPWNPVMDETEVYCVCDLDPLPYNLLYVSRAIHDEVSFILYSENQFKICRSAPSGLSPLLNLGVRALASLTSLSVRLNACLYIPRYHCPEINRHGWWGNCDYHKACKSVPDKPFGQVASRHDKLFMSEWTEVCYRIAAHGTSRLRLSLMCDIGNLETARKITQPLEMAILGKCSIRLGQDPTPETIHLAQASALHAMKVPDTEPFRFTDLPGEIQDQILGYTDLVAPDELEWSPRIGLYTSRLYTRHCCRTCTDTLEACYCPTQHAAFSPSCTCWSFPLPIFRASRKVNSAATRIFYSQNHFIVNQFEPKGHDRSEFRPVLEISQFLRGLPARALPHLRSISWLLPKVDPHRLQYLVPGASDASDWRQTILFMTRNLELWKLNLTLDMSAGRCDYPFESSEHKPESRTEHAMWDRYVRIVEPLSLLKQTHLKKKGLKNLFIHVSWPCIPRAIAEEEESLKQWAPQRLAGDGWEAISREKPGSVEKRDEWAQILERRVMGRDYDSFARGKLRGFSKEEMVEAAGDGPMYLVKHSRRRRNRPRVLGPDGSQVWPTSGMR
jgi:hypothetical protein